MSQNCRSWALTHPGSRRSLNEDALVDRPDLGLWAVADGAGGHSAGEVASGMIATALGDVPQELSAAEMLAEVRLRISAVHDALRTEAASRGPDVTIASTVVVLVARDDHFCCLWAGDSRAYLLREGVLQPITRDHSLVQEMVDSGVLTQEEAEGHPRSNIITRAVGAGEDDVELDKTTDRLLPGDRFLLCSDGLCKALAESDLVLLAADETSPAEQLVEAALRAEASDNVTAVVVAVPD